MEQTLMYLLKESRCNLKGSYHKDNSPLYNQFQVVKNVLHPFCQAQFKLELGTVKQTKKGAEAPLLFFFVYFGI